MEALGATGIRACTQEVTDSNATERNKHFCVSSWSRYSKLFCTIISYTKKKLWFNILLLFEFACQFIGGWNFHVLFLWVPYNTWIDHSNWGNFEDYSPNHHQILCSTISNTLQEHTEIAAESTHMFLSEWVPQNFVYKEYYEIERMLFSNFPYFKTQRNFTPSSYFLHEG